MAHALEARVSAAETVSAAASTDIDRLRARLDAAWARTYALSLDAAGLDEFGDLRHEGGETLEEGDGETATTSNNGGPQKREVSKGKKPAQKPDELPLGLHFRFVCLSFAPLFYYQKPPLVDHN